MALGFAGWIVVPKGLRILAGDEKRGDQEHNADVQLHVLIIKIAMTWPARGSQALKYMQMTGVQTLDVKRARRRRGL
jgi:hypothetical protein